MNYHKKLLSIGFKKSKEAIVVVPLNESWTIEGKKIIPISDIKEKKFSYEMNLYINCPFLETYIWKVSPSITAYITSSKLDYCCFVYDKDAEDTKDGYYLQRNKVSIIKIGRFNQEFWKEITEELPRDIKREILLKQIL